MNALAKASSEEVEGLLARQARLAGPIRRALIEAVRSMGQQLDLDDLEQMLRRGQYSAAVDYIYREALQRGFRPVASRVTAATLEAGRIASRAIPSRAEVIFDGTNERIVTYLRQHTGEFITGLTNEARATVSQVILRDVQAGVNPLDTARRLRQVLGLTLRQEQAVANYRRNLEQLSRQALDRELRDRRFDSTVERAVDEGLELSGEKIDRMVDRYRDRYVAYRAETVARTEAMSALNEGSLQAWSQAAGDGLIERDRVRRFWVYTRDNKTREAHRDIPSLNPDGVGLDEPFETPDGPLMYPGDPMGPPEAIINCRCTVIVRYVTAAAARTLAAP